MKLVIYMFIAVGVIGLMVPMAEAHFRLLAPSSWMVEDEVGNPQKLGPCGGTSQDVGTPSGAVTKLQGGQKLHIKVQETVFHPGHYRIALAVNSRSELPEDPVVETRDSEHGPMSVSAKIAESPTVPVLADGLWQHTARTTEPFETDVQLPNIDCPACILQVAEFMANHAYNKDGGYTYHHCAVLNITADPAKPRDAGWPAVR